MATRDQETLKSAEPEKPKANPNIIRFTAPAKLTGFLWYLAKNTTLGDTANEVALSLLMIEAERRLLTDFHKVVVPTAEPTPAP